MRGSVELVVVVGGTRLIPLLIEGLQWVAVEKLR